MTQQVKAAAEKQTEQTGHSSARTKFGGGGPNLAGELMALQDAAGNTAVTQLIERPLSPVIQSSDGGTPIIQRQANDGENVPPAARQIINELAIREEDRQTLLAAMGDGRGERPAVSRQTLRAIGELERPARMQLLRALESPTGARRGRGGYLEYGQDNLEMFRTYFESHIPSNLDVTVEDLTVLSSDVSAYNPDLQELPPRELWPNMVKTLQVLSEWKQAFPNITFKVESAYRSELVNALAGGALGGKHPHFSALDVEPQGGREEKEKLVAYLRVYYHMFGESKDLGLGIYGLDRIHLDTIRHRTWTGVGDSLEEAWQAAQEMLDRPLQQLLYPGRRRQPLGPPEGGGAIQPKLRVGQPDDEYEKEADQVASEVMRMSAPAPVLDREEPLRRKKRSAEMPSPDNQLEEQFKSLQGTGQPLPRSTRAFFERRFGQDFSEVRVHTGPKADEAAESINANAFTLESDVIFADGQYRPQTWEGKTLLAHELTHVAQQRSLSGLPVQRQNVEAPSGVSIELWPEEPQKEMLHKPREFEEPREYVQWWLRRHKDEIVAAEKQYGIDRRAIAGATAWEALKNVKSWTGFGLARFRGPGKVHYKEIPEKERFLSPSGISLPYTYKLLSLPYRLTEGKPIAKEVEKRGYLPWGPQSLTERRKRLSSVSDSIQYIGAIMKLFFDAARKEGIYLCEPELLTTFYNAWDIEDAKTVFRLKKKSELNPNKMGKWVKNNLGYLEEAVGKTDVECFAPAAHGAEAASVSDVLDLAHRSFSAALSAPWRPRDWTLPEYTEDERMVMRNFGRLMQSVMKREVKRLGSFESFWEQEDSAPPPTVRKHLGSKHDDVLKDVVKIVNARAREMYGEMKVLTYNDFNNMSYLQIIRMLENAGLLSIY